MRSGWVSAAADATALIAYCKAGPFVLLFSLMKHTAISEKFVLITYFVGIISIGAILLSIPAAWAGEGRLGLIDAMFTSVSAVCVTGLITVDTAQYSLFGQIVILLLIQFGGLGILTFTTVIFISSAKSKKVSLRNLQTVRGFYLDSIEFKAHHILSNIIKLTFGVELVGALLLWLRFRSTVGPGAVFHAIFHAVSAFCNAGFSLFSDSLMGYQKDPYVLIVIMVLIISGGLGFLIFNDLFHVIRKEKKRLSLHTFLVLRVTLILIITGTVLVAVLEFQGVLRGLGPVDFLVNSLFQAVTPRTAGFNAVDESMLSASSKALTIILMFIGGSPASIAGGIKTTTFAIVMLAVIKEVDWKGRIRVKDRVLSSAMVTKAMMFLAKAFALLNVSIFLLTITEMRGDPSIQFFDVMFESVSAFGTVGLSTGLTPHLSSLGKLVIIGTMFAGRVGLMALTIPLFIDREDMIDYPEEEVLIG